MSTGNIHDTEMQKLRLLQRLVLAGTAFSGILAGGNADRYIVQVPSFLKNDIISWAHYSRHADLGNGLWFYPLEAIGGFLLFAIAAAIAWKLRHYINPSAVFITLALAALGLVFTLFAAPVMLRLQHMPDDPVALKIAFLRFHFWGALRAIVQISAFISSLFAMKSVYRKH